ncbi:MAG: hypothetical protein ACLUE1_00455 [Adlercreutzia equolifaciens]
MGAAIFLAVIAVAAIIWVSWRVGVLALATAAAMGVLGNYTMRRSPEGNDIAAHAKPCATGCAMAAGRSRATSSLPTSARRSFRTICSVR